MALEFTPSCLQDSLDLFRFYKKMGEKAMAQLADPELYASLDPEMNSVAVIVKHLAGNMRSRWTGFPDVDGESPTRNRDSEFLEPPASRTELLALWDDGWQRLFAALEPLTDADLARPVAIRGEVHSITQAIHRQLAHYAYHVGQIVFLAKHLRSAHWRSLSIPRRGSADFHRRVAQGEASQR
ncbi:MAG TPA: DUF1572 family protein [Terriglobales bacterium]|nr:DUF1572 family protein [Terriglobales bacterium]